MAHETLVTRQFESAAEGYRESPVHAQGADLAVFRARAEERTPRAALDVGAGTGHVAFTIAPFCQVVHAVDASPAMLAILTAEATARGLTQVQVHEAQAAALPVPDASMDLVTCRYNAHHWHRLDAGLAEIARVLRPDGLFVLTDALGSATALVDTHLQALELLRDPSHVRDHDQAQWIAALARAGLSVTRSETTRVRLDLDSWLARAHTPPERALVIRALLADAPEEVRAALTIEVDAFWLDVLTCEARKA